MIENSFNVGKYFRKSLESIYDCNSPIVSIRGKGLFNAIEFDGNDIAEKCSLNLLKNGLLTKTTQGNTLRLCPPLTITKQQIDESLQIIQKSIKNI